MYKLLENVFISKELYQTMISPLCDKYDMTQAEMTVLLFLANNPQKDTATDIVEKRRMTKSSVSMAARALQEKGLIFGEYVDGNHRSIHLKVCDNALNIIEDGRKAQNKFFEVLTKDFTEAERTAFKEYIMRVTDNIRNYNESAE